MKLGCDEDSGDLEGRDGVVRVSGHSGYVNDGEYDGDGSIREAYIDFGVREIGSMAFRNCKNLRKVDFPQTLRWIGAGAFAFCENLQEVSMVDYVHRIGTDAFAACTSLKEIRLPEELFVLGVGAFSGCTGLREVEIPGYVLLIDRECFSHCTGLQRVEIPFGVVKIGAGAFCCCGSQLDLQVAPDNRQYSAHDGFLLSKDGQTLYGCTASQGTVTIPDSVVAIEERALGEAGITQVTLPEGLRSIGEKAFLLCRYLK